jgi:F420-non-reducing hydrogenase large subunit
MRQLGQMMIDRFAGKAIHPIAAVVGGFSKPMLDSERTSLLKDAQVLLDFSLYALDYAKKMCSTNILMLSESWGLLTPVFLALLTVLTALSGCTTAGSA